MIGPRDRHFIGVSIDSSYCWGSLVMISILLMFYTPETLTVLSLALRLALRESVEKSSVNT